MAFNRTDTRQRAYCPIGAYNPSGNWVDEPAYNKFPEHHAGTKGILVGNWNEEEVLRDSMKAIDDQLPKSPLKKSPYDPNCKIGIRCLEVPNKQNSVFLTTKKFKDKLNDLSETQDAFRGTQPKKPQLGARTAVLHEQIDQEVLSIPEEVKVQYPSSEWQTTQNITNSSLPVKYPESLDPSIAPDEYLRMPAITTHNYTYKNKLPYGATFPTGDNPQKRNTNFSSPIQQFNKSACPRY
jgi:hypothetical protein